jgi:hypothetical protein
MRQQLLTILFAITLIGSACGSDTPSTEAQVSDLSVEYSCGLGFYLSNPEETTALYVFAEVQEPESPARLAGSPDWRAELHIGVDLFASWCNDVVLPDTPEPVLLDVWEVSGGTIELTSPLQDCGPVSAEIADVVVTTPDGDEIELDDRTVTNSGWGCFAG